MIAERLNESGYALVKKGRRGSWYGRAPDGTYIRVSDHHGSWILGGRNRIDIIIDSQQITRVILTELHDLNGMSGCP